MYVQVMKQILTLNKNSRYRIVEKPYTIKNLPFIFLASLDFSVESKNYGIVNKVSKNIVNRGREAAADLGGGGAPPFPSGIRPPADPKCPPFDTF